jgi:tetratricopeptide (TPR) repeat protein
MPNLNNSQIAVAIVIDAESNQLESTINNVKLITDKIFLLGIDLTDEMNEYIDSIDWNNRLISVSGLDDYSAAKNRLIDHVELNGIADWLLWMDAGDEFLENTIDDFKQFVETESDRNNLYVLALQRFAKFDRSRHDLDEETIAPRLIPMRKGLRFSGRVRESIVPTAMKLLIKISAAPGRIICPTKYGESEMLIRRGQRKLDLLDRLEQQGEIIDNEKLMYRAEAKFDFGEFVEVRRDLVKLIESTHIPLLKLEGYYLFWETTLFSPIADDPMTRMLVNALDLFPVDMQLLLFMGQHLQKQKRFDLALRTYETAIQHGRISLDVWHRLRIIEIIIVCTAFVKHLRGENDEAIAILEANLDNVIDIAEYTRHLLNLYIAELHETKARELVSILIGGEQLDLLRDAITGACHGSAGRWNEALFTLEKAYQNGCRDQLCLRWFSLALVSAGRNDDAVRVIEEWIQLTPNNNEARLFLQAASQPEHFSEVLARLGLNYYAISSNRNKVDGKNIERVEAGHAIHEMISASGRVDQQINEKQEVEVQI